MPKIVNLFGSRMYPIRTVCVSERTMRYLKLRMLLSEVKDT